MHYTRALSRAVSSLTEQGKKSVGTTRAMVESECPRGGRVRHVRSFSDSMNDTSTRVGVGRRRVPSSAEGASLETSS